MEFIKAWDWKPVQWRRKTHMHFRWKLCLNLFLLIRSILKFCSEAKVRYHEAEPCGNAIQRNSSTLRIVHRFQAWRAGRNRYRGFVRGERFLWLANIPMEAISQRFKPVLKLIIFGYWGDWMDGSGDPENVSVTQFLTISTIEGYPSGITRFRAKHNFELHSSWNWDRSERQRMRADRGNENGRDRGMHHRRPRCQRIRSAASRRRNDQTVTLHSGYESPI